MNQNHVYATSWAYKNSLLKYLWQNITFLSCGLISNLYLALYPAVIPLIFKHPAFLLWSQHFFLCIVFSAASQSRPVTVHCRISINLAASWLYSSPSLTLAQAINWLFFILLNLSSVTPQTSAEMSTKLAADYLQASVSNRKIPSASVELTTVQHKTTIQLLHCPSTKFLTSC